MMLKSLAEAKGDLDWRIGDLVISWFRG